MMNKLIEQKIDILSITKDQELLIKNLLSLSNEIVFMAQDDRNEVFSLYLNHLKNNNIKSKTYISNITNKEIPGVVLDGKRNTTLPISIYIGVGDSSYIIIRGNNMHGFIGNKKTAAHAANISRICSRLFFSN